MTSKIVSDELWIIVEPLLPEPRTGARGGRPPISNRAALTGIIFVLRSGIPWRMLPLEMGCGSGVTCWRRLRDWQQAGVWERLHQALLQQLHDADRLDWSRACMDSATLSAKKGGSAIGPNPTDRGRPGTKRHLLTDRRGTPLAVLLSGANMNDSVPLAALLDHVSPVQGRRGRPRHRPRKLHADKAYDHRRCRRSCRRRGIRPRIARRGVEDSRRLGRHRWVVERTFSWLSGFRRLVTRYERRVDIHYALTLIGCSLICFNRLQNRF
ncbi:IS5 family transposase [Salinicola sp. LHM]|uniref:IS5 family transposase n=1 Tax=unclassified Salinicola TaxID=2634022 RepID=UPI001114B83A|nr:MULTISPECIES: IS5 family transposase [unclassified Salinicola]WQH32114.1 IS5 family transposase [Salinicola sp. LHM]